MTCVIGTNSIKCYRGIKAYDESNPNITKIRLKKDGSIWYVRMPRVQYEALKNDNILNIERYNKETRSIEVKKFMKFGIELVSSEG